MPWTLPGDLAHFRDATMGRPVIMGRRTFESIGRPLPGRPTIVVSGDPDFAPEGVLVTRTPGQALDDARTRADAIGADCIMVAGGAAIYRALMPCAQCLLITEIDAQPDGDVYFPPIEPRQWREIDRRQASLRPDDTDRYAFARFERRDACGDAATNEASPVFARSQPQS